MNRKRREEIWSVKLPKVKIKTFKPKTIKSLMGEKDE